jgi:RimJ/RimL family protein N-acetyltransferase
LERLISEALRLRRARETDLDALCAILAVPAVAHGYFGAVTTAPDDLARRALRYNFERERLGLAASWVACDDRDEPFGYVTVVDGLLAYFVQPDLWRLGHATALAASGCRAAFAHRPGVPVRACVFRDNRASVRVLEGLGFRFTGLHHPNILGAHLPVPMLTYVLDESAFDRSMCGATGGQHA